MKIAQVNVFFSPFMVGGAEWYVFNVSRELASKGHDVHVFTAARYNGTEAKASEVIEGINVHRLPMRIDWSYRMKVWKGLDEALTAGSFDVIHTYDYAQPHSRVALRAARKTGSATALTVFDVHSMIPRVWYKQFPMKMMEGYLGKRTLPSADKVLVRAPNLIPPLLKLGGDSDRMIVTPSGIRDESLGVFDDESFRTKHQITGSPVVLFLGRLNPLKGPQHLLDAAPSILKEFPDASFVFVGADQSGYADTLRKQAARLGVSSSVHFLGPIYDFQEKMQAYASSTVFVLPTTYEGTSQAIFEAMSQGKPVVATNVGGIPYQITDGVEGFLVAYGDSNLLSGKIMEVLRNPTLAADLGRRGKERVRANRYSVLTASLEKIYPGGGKLNLDGARVLVTGGAGFIGSHLTERLLEMGAFVTVYDRFDDFYEGKERNLAAIAGHEQFSLVKADILDVEKLDSALRGVDVLFHQAGQAGIGFSIKHPLKVNDVNVNGTLNVLTLARKNDVKRIVNASSSSIFGEPEYLPIDESHPTNPTSPYGVSKLAAEQYCRAFHRVYGTDVVSLRYFSVYGPRGRPDQVIHRFTKSLVEGKPPVIQGDGSHSRDFTYVADIVATNIAAAKNDGLGGEVFNIGFGSRTSVSELAERLARIIRPDADISPTFVEEGPGEFPHTQASNLKAGELLHWKPKVGLDEGLKMYVDWFTMPTAVVRKAR